MRALLAASLGLALLAPPAEAVLRSPQVPVSGSGLQSLLTAHGQTIAVSTDQQVLFDFHGVGVAPSYLATFVLSPIGTPAAPLALYDDTDPSPAPLHAVVAPAGIPAGGYAVAAYNTSLGLVVNVFDSNGAPQGTTTYPQPPAFNLLFALVTPDGMLFANDSRNPGQQPRLLFYQGTGAHAYDVWICGETDGDADFDDAVYRLENFSLTPARRTTWGAIKQRFR